jgi:hypothetical protein
MRSRQGNVMRSTTPWRNFRRSDRHSAIHTPVPFRVHPSCESFVHGRDAARGEACTGHVGDWFVIAAIAPEAQHDPKGFIRACRAAEKRLIELEE